MDIFHGILVGLSASHSNQEIILVLNQENKDVLGKAIFSWCHVMLWVRQHARLEDSSQIAASHAILIGLGCKYCKKIENIQQQLSIEWRELSDKALVLKNDAIHILLRPWLATVVHRVLSKRLSKPVVKVQWDNWLGKLVQVSAKHVGGIVHRVSFPIQALSISVWRVECLAEFFNALFRTTQAENSLDIGGFLFQEDTTFRNDYWNIAINIAVSFAVDQRDRNIRILYALTERYSKDASWCFC